MANDLNLLADTLNEVLERAEKVLVRHRVSGSIVVEGEKLGFRKVGDHWRLAWLEDGCEPFLVANSGRELRLLAAGAVPELDYALSAEATKLGDRLRAAIADLEAFVVEHENERTDCTD